MDIGVKVVQCEIGSHTNERMVNQTTSNQNGCSGDGTKTFTSEFSAETKDSKAPYEGGRINRAYTFSNHVEGVSNQLARAVCLITHCLFTVVLVWVRRI